MNELVSVLKKDLEDLDKRFNKKNRDVIKLSIANKSIERITNDEPKLILQDVLKLTKITFNGQKEKEIQKEV